MKTINFSAYHPILNMEDHVVFASNGNGLLCYELALVEIYSVLESHFKQLHDSCFQAFKSLPSEIVIQKQYVYKKCAYSADGIANVIFLQKATHRYFKN